jgi:hypothetical protein
MHKITLVYTLDSENDTWEGLYVDGILIKQARTIQITHIAKYCPIQTTDQFYYPTNGNVENLPNELEELLKK